MPNTICANCGAEMAAGARFCRQCGRAAAAMEGASVTEATTRLLETPTKTADATRPPTYTAAEPTELSAADTRSIHAAAARQGLTSTKRQRTVLLLSLALSGVLLVAFAALLALWYSMKSAGVKRPPAIIVSHPPPMGDLKQAGTPLIYPNATVVQNIIRDGKPMMVRLRTPDSFDKVVAWYEAKLQPTQKIISTGANAVLKASKATVIINGAGNETSIMLTQPSEE